MLNKFAVIGLAASVEIALVVVAPIAAMAQTTAAATEIKCVKTVDGEHLTGTVFRNAIAACKPKAKVAKQKPNDVGSASQVAKAQKRAATKAFRKASKAKNTATPMLPASL
jgi:hypothetical protein